MNFLPRFCLLLQVFVLGPVAQAGELHSYQLEIQGMACAFCVYKTSQQLASLTGVKQDSIQVDLQTGAIRLVSSQPLHRDRVREVVNKAGFQLVRLESTGRGEVPKTATGKPALHIEIPAAEVGSNPINDVLKSLGEIYADYPQSRLEIHAPADWENRIMRPLLMGRQQVYTMDFQPRTSGRDVTIQWFPNEPPRETQ